MTMILPTPDSIPSKHELALLALLEAGKEGLSKLSAINLYGETSLPTTISELGLKRGFRLERQQRKHRHRYGGVTHFTWYWLADYGEACRAVCFINELRSHRKAEPLTRESSDQLIRAFR